MRNFVPGIIAGLLVTGPGIALAQPATSADIAAVIKELQGVRNDTVYSSGQIGAKLDTLHNDLQALIKQLQQSPTTAQAPATGPAAAIASTEDKFFPADPGLAMGPSPENSKIARLGTKISGRPYLIDSSQLVHQLVPQSTQFPNGYAVNGAPTKGGGNEEAFVLLLERQGKVYAQRAGGPWQSWNPGMGSMYNAGLPDAFPTDASGATTSTVATSTVKTPVRAARAKIAPGSSGKTLTVCAKSCAYTTLTKAIGAAAAGDTISLGAGTYKEAPPAIAVTLKIVWEAGAVLDLTGLTDKLAHGKGAIVPMTDILLVNPVITGTAMDQGSAQGTAAIRPETGCNYIDIQGGELYKNQNGVAGGGIPVVVTMTGTKLHDNGLGDGYTHNIYMSNDTVALILKDVVSVNPNAGHALKSRAFDTTVTGGEFEAFSSAAVDVPQGSVSPAVFDGVTFTKKAGAYNHTVLDYATENNDSGNGGMVIRNSTMNILCDSPKIMVGSASVVTIEPTTKFLGTKPEALGGRVAGL